MSLGVTWGVSSSLRRGCSRTPMFSGPTRPVSFSPKRIAADRDAVLGTALRGRGAWHSSDRFSGTVRARESAQTAPGSDVRCRLVARGGVGPPLRIRHEEISR